MQDDATAQQNSRSTSRRAVLGFGFAALFGLMADPAAASLLRAPERELYLTNPHTGDVFRDVYWARGKYVRDATEDLNFLMRDFRIDQQVEMDPALLDLLFHIQTRVGPKKPICVMSGYRSPQTNRMLQEEGLGAVENSMHLYGKAADIHVEHIRLTDMRRVAVSLKAGGVGTYTRSNFLHVDTGRIRFW
jgi:uncharacterized protein YcbK (DUF882 family)